MNALEPSTARVLSGPIPREVFRFGAPLSIGMGLQTAFNLVDAYLIGRLDPSEAGPSLGAIGIADQLAALGTILSYGLTTAAATLLSRREGQGDRDAVRHLAAQSLWPVLALSLLFGVGGGFFARVLMSDVVGAKGEVALLGGRYLAVMMAGNFSIFLLLHLTSLLRALGSAKTPVAVLVGANVLNLFLAVLLVYGPGQAPPIFAFGPPIAQSLGLPRLGLLGAAWATLFARVVMLLPLVLALRLRYGVLRAEDLGRPDKQVVGAILRLGWPASAQLLVRILAMLVTHSVVARTFTTDSDQTATIALGIVFRLETMAFFVGLGWGSAAQTFIGQNLGAGKLERAKLAGYYAALFNAGMMALIALAYRAFGADIVGLFDPNPEVIRFALTYFAWVGPAYVGLGIGIVLGSAMQGAGATRRAFLLDASVVLLFQLPASLLVGFVPGSTFTHLALSVALTYLAFACVHAMSYRRGRFLHALPG